MLSVWDELQASSSILKPDSQSFSARLRTNTSLMSPPSYANQQQIPLYLFLHHLSSKLLCKWHSSLSLFCKYDVIGGVNNPFVCLTRSSAPPPVSLIQLLGFEERGEWGPDLRAAHVNDIQIDHRHMLLRRGPFKTGANEKRSSPLWRA